MNDPTFYQDIKPLFTQYDRIKMMYFVDLWNYKQVRDNAKNIHMSLQPGLIDGKPDPAGWSLLPGVHVMPKYTGQWPQQQIDLIGKWITAGCLEGKAPEPVNPGPLTENFLALSRVLTGFDNLDDRTLAQTYIDRLLKESTHAGNNALTDLLQTFTQNPDVLTGDGRLTAAYKNYMALLQDITVLWYINSINGQLGTARNNQYTEGLVWRAIEAHPMGYANSNVQFYWQYKPEDGMYTGLQDVIPRVLVD